MSYAEKFLKDKLELINREIDRLKIDMDYHTNELMETNKDIERRMAEKRDIEKYLKERAHNGNYEHGTQNESDTVRE